MSDQNNNALDLSGDGLEDQKDVIRKPGDYSVATGVRRAIIKLAYLGKSKGGASFLTTQYTLPDDGKTLSVTEYFTSGDAKGNKTYSVARGSDKKNPLPGFTKTNELCLAATGEGLASVYAKRETKKVNLWNPTKRQEEPTDVEVLPELHGKEVFLGIHKIEKNKQVEHPAGSGKWVDSNERRTVNEIDKIFTDERKTVNEKMAGDTASFVDTWIAEFGEKTLDQFKEVANAPKSGAPAADRTGGTNDEAIFD